MAPPVQTQPPTTIRQGTTVTWLQALADYPPSEGWTVTAKLAGAKVVSATVAVVDGAYQVTFTATQTAALSPGGYTLALYATQGATVDEVATWQVPVLASVLAATDGAFVSHAERTLAIIEAAIEGRLTKDQESYQVDGLAISRIPIERLTALRGVYAGMVWRERNRGQAFPARVVRFGRAS